MQKWQGYQGIYVHIPFCVQKCQYCDFASYGGLGREVQDAYTEALCREICSRRAELPVAAAATVYFGGGTPSCLEAENIARIVTALRKSGYWQDPAEATIEVNPGTVMSGKLEAFRAMGFDRVSIGVQSLDAEVLRTMGRIHSPQQALEAIRFAREAGFRRVSADLIYGYPRQDIASLRRSLEGLCGEGLSHISVYGLSVEEGTPLQHSLNEGKLQLPSEEECGDMYDLVTSYLPRQGLQRYEISNYAVPGEEARHNLVYWQYLPYLGFGAGATGFDGVRRRKNSEDLEQYIQKGATETEELTSRELLGEYIFMNLRKAEGLNPSEAEERFGLNILKEYEKEIDPLAEQGLIKEAKGCIRLTEQGMRYGNRVFMAFL